MILPSSPSIVERTAVRASPFLVYLHATLSADIFRPCMTEIAPECERDIEDEQRIAHIIQRADGEHHIIESAHARQTQQVKHGLAHLQMPERIIHRGYGHDDHQPYRRDEERQQQRLCKRVERRMEIEMPPRLRCEQLDGGIECGRECHDERQQRRIERVDVAEMHDMRIMLDHQAHGIAHEDKQQYK